MGHDWAKELQKRRQATIGDKFHLGKTKLGREELILPVVKITPTQLTCSDGERTERVMIFSGKVVGRFLDYARLVDV